MTLIALQEALWPKLYSHQDPLNQLRRTGIILLLMAAMCSSAIWLTAPVVPLLFGNDFNGITHVMRILALLPILQVLRGLISFRTIYHQQMSLIGWTNVTGASLSVLTVSILVPTYGIEGAAMSAYASEAAMLAMLSFGSKRRSR